jgi:hypothetical protein
LPFFGLLLFLLADPFRDYSDSKEVAVYFFTEFWFDYVPASGASYFFAFTLNFVVSSGSLSETIGYSS